MKINRHYFKVDLRGINMYEMMEYENQYNIECTKVYWPCTEGKEITHSFDVPHQRIESEELLACVSALIQAYMPFEDSIGLVIIEIADMTRRIPLRISCFNKTYSQWREEIRGILNNGKNYEFHSSYYNCKLFISENKLVIKTEAPISIDGIKFFDKHLQQIQKKISENKEIVIDTGILWEKKCLAKYIKEYFYDAKKILEHDERSICDLIEEQVRRTPESIAYIFDSKSYTYRDISEKSNTIAAAILMYTIGKKCFIPVIMERSIELVIAIWAIMKAGCAFVPIDIYWPEERVCMVLEQIKPLVIIGETKKFLLEDRYNIISFSYELTDNTVKKFPKIYGNDPIYIIYTSGSMGIPKGAINYHKGIVNRFLYMNKRYHPTEKDVILLTSNHAFDASIWQLLWPQINGICTVIPKPSENLNIIHLVKLVKEYKVTITDFVPAVFNLLVELMELRPAMAEQLVSLRQLLIGGEIMDSKYIYRFKEINKKCSITNTYGPSETSIGTVFYEVKENFETEIPIGKPIDNVKILVLDRNKKIVPPGVKGELYLGGVCIGGGYLGDTKKTKESFLEIPYLQEEQSVFYKTGDLVWMSFDGNLRYCGRIDQQVKINGVRVEIKEIEKCFLKLDEVKNVIVRCKRHKEKGKYLCAYIVLQKEWSPEMQKLIKCGISKFLPLSMQPSKYVFLEKIPINRNGKIDYKILDKMEDK